MGCHTLSLVERHHLVGTETDDRREHFVTEYFRHKYQPVHSLTVSEIRVTSHRTITTVFPCHGPTTIVFHRLVWGLGWSSLIRMFGKSSVTSMSGGEGGSRGRCDTT